MAIAAAHLIEIQNDTAYTMIRFFGYVDASTVEKARPLVQEKLGDTCKNIVIDLQKVEFLDSHGVGLFVNLLKHAHKKGGRLVFAGAEGQPASVLGMVGFNNTLVSYCKDMAAAKEALEN